MTIEIRSNVVEKAIARSASHNEIVNLIMSNIVEVDDVDGDESFRDALREVAMRCASVVGDDSVVNGDVVEMWGTTDDGDDFRVHFILR